MGALLVVLAIGYSHVLVDERSLENELLQKPYSVRQLNALFDRAVSSGKIE